MKFPNPFKRSKHVNLLRLDGIIMADSGLNDARLERAIKQGFKNKPAALAVLINSPGGSPVQSSLIGARLRREAEKAEVPIFAFVEDMAASGGYWLACVADEVYLDAASIVGSIGVVGSRFGYVDLMEKLGIERRQYTAGESKGFGDPFLPEKSDDVAHMEEILDAIHQTFITHVKTHRGDKLAEDESLFTGRVWVGQAGVNIGLADGIGHYEPVLREKFGKTVKFHRIKIKRGLKEQLGIPGLSHIGAALNGRLNLR